MKGLLVLLAVIAAVAANQCPSEQEVNWEIELLLRHEDCEKFYKCTFGQPVEQVCPDGLYFNLDFWQCDWKDNVDCSDRNVPGAEPEPEPEVVEPEVVEPEPEVVVPEPEPEVVEPEPEPEVVEPEPEPEVPTVVPEPEETPIVVPEPEPEVVDPEPEVVEPEPEPEVVEPEPEVVEPETEPEVVEPEPEPEIEFLDNGCPVNPHIHWLLPHEDDCNLFYYCVWGEKVLRQCPSSLHFNRDIQVCDWPWDAGCPTALNKHAFGRLCLQRLVL